MEFYVFFLIALGLVGLGFAVWRFRSGRLPKEEPRALPPRGHVSPKTQPIDALSEIGEAEAVEPAEQAPPPSAPPPPAPPVVRPPPPVAATKPPSPTAEVPSEPEEPPTQKEKEKEEGLRVLRKGLAATRGGFVSRLAKLFEGRKDIDPSLLDEVEEVLITADIGVRTADRILAKLRERLARHELDDSDRIWAALREEASDILNASRGRFALPSQKPAVVLAVGVNGVGKTTTVGKIASLYASQGKQVVLAAADTFRAAAVLQLEVWARRAGCEIVRGKDRADPSSVVFDAIRKAQDLGADVVLIDTAGRLHTKTPLMEELEKVGRTVEKAAGRPADETLLVLDATTGQNAIQQVQLFSDAMPISGMVLTKLDGTAKGGIVLGIVDQYGIPVRYVGIGERLEDLRAFDPDEFVKALLDKPGDESMAA